MVESSAPALLGAPFPLRRRARKILTSPRAVVRRTGLLLGETLASAWRHRILGLSAETAFWQLLSLPSLLIALVASLGYLRGVVGADVVARVDLQVKATFSQAFTPEVVHQLIGPTVDDVLADGRFGVVSLGFVLALWAGSSATATFVNTIAIAYDQRDGRGPVRSRLLALWLFLGSVGIGVLVLPMLVLGPDLLARIAPGQTGARIVAAGYYPVVGLLVLVGLTSLYRLSPPRRLPWLRGLPGGCVALAVFLAGSAGLRAYIAYVLSRNDAYGSLGTPVAALLFFYVLALGVLLGAEFNAAIERTWPAVPLARSRVLHSVRSLDPRTPRDRGGDAQSRIAS